MTAQVIDGKQIAEQTRAEAAEGARQLKAENGVVPHLAAVLVGDDPASAVYVRNKHIACEKAGFKSTLHRLPATTTQAELMALVHALNADPDVHGILVQLPLPPHIDAERVTDRIDPRKDVDGFHPDNIGRLVQKRPVLRPCTPYGCMRLLQETGEDLVGKHAVVIGQSNIVGRPMALELPTYKRPSVRTALLTMVDRGLMFVKKAGTNILAICIVLWWLGSYPKVAAPAQYGTGALRAHWRAPERLPRCCRHLATTSARRCPGLPWFGRSTRSGR